MLNTEVQYTITIDAPFYEIQSFLNRTSNLTLWTTFFQDIISDRKNYCRLKTPLGDSITTIVEERNQKEWIFNIISKFIQTKRKEKARIFLSAEDNNIFKVKFIINPPASVSEAVVEKLSENMKNELLKLKRILEIKNEKK